MRISALAERGGVPLPTVKYYLREGLLPAGTRTAATQAQYDERHLERLRLVRALLDVGSLSIATARGVLRAMDQNGPRRIEEALGQVQEQLPPRVDGDVDTTDAEAVITRLRWQCDSQSAAMRQLAVAMHAATQVGMPVHGPRLEAYADAAYAVATSDIDGMPVGDGARVFGYAVIGTLFYEPVLLALRRLAHQDRTDRLAVERR